MPSFLARGNSPSASSWISRMVAPSEGEGSEEASNMLSPEDIVKHDKLAREADEREFK